MRYPLLAATAIALVLAGCSTSSSNQGPTAEIAACLTGAGARIATDPSELTFAEPWTVTDGSSHPDQSGTLSVGFYQGRGSGGWAVYYVVRKGYRVSLATLRRQPTKNAKAVAYIQPKDPAAMKDASACLERSKP